MFRARTAQFETSWEQVLEKSQKEPHGMIKRQFDSSALVQLISRLRGKDRFRSLYFDRTAPQQPSFNFYTIHHLKNTFKRRKTIMSDSNSLPNFLTNTDLHPSFDADIKDVHLIYDYAAQSPDGKPEKWRYEMWFQSSNRINYVRTHLLSLACQTLTSHLLLLTSLPKPRQSTAAP